MNLTGIDPSDDIYKTIFTMAANIEVMNWNKTQQEKFWNPLNEVIIDCMFNFQHCNISEDFDFWYDTMFGICYRFKTEVKTNNKIVKPGYLNGLSFKIFLGHSQIKSPLSYGNGLNLYIHNVILF